MTTVQIVSGNIAEVPADALITTHNSFGFGPGYIDLAITNVAADMFHPLVPHNLRDGKACVVRATGAHAGAFKHVLFVGDDWKKPLLEIVLAALKQAERVGLHSVSLPILRTGAAQKMTGDSKEKNMQAMVAGINQFRASKPSHLQTITLVTYKDSSGERYFKQALGL